MRLNDESIRASNKDGGDLTAGKVGVGSSIAHCVALEMRSAAQVGTWAAARAGVRAA